MTDKPPLLLLLLPAGGWEEGGAAVGMEGEQGPSPFVLDRVLIGLVVM